MNEGRWIIVRLFGFHLNDENVTRVCTPATEKSRT